MEEMLTYIPKLLLVKGEGWPRHAIGCGVTSGWGSGCPRCGTPSWANALPVMTFAAVANLITRALGLSK